MRDYRRQLDEANGLKDPRQRKAAVRRIMQRVCRCGLRFSHHGALPPHDRGEECKGFELTGSEDS